MLLTKRQKPEPCLLIKTTLPLSPRYIRMAAKSLAVQGPTKFIMHTILTLHGGPVIQMTLNSALCLELNLESHSVIQ